MSDLQWRKSSYSNGPTECVEVGSAGDRVHVRNSVHPDAGTLVLPTPTMAAWIAGIHAGDLDDLTA